jgi:hypothetical protein
MSTKKNSHSIVYFLRDIQFVNLRQGIPFCVFKFPYLFFPHFPPKFLVSVIPIKDRKLDYFLNQNGEFYKRNSKKKK